MEAVKGAMVRWIETGEGASATLGSISALVTAKAAEGDATGGRARLVLLSPFAISVEGAASPFVEPAKLALEYGYHIGGGILAMLSLYFMRDMKCGGGKKKEKKPKTNKKEGT